VYSTILIVLQTILDGSEGITQAIAKLQNAGRLLRDYQPINERAMALIDSD